MVEAVQANEWIKYGMSKKPYQVAESCNEKYTGQWVCATHPDSFLYNQFEKDSHIHEGKHRLVWWCSGHGPEQP